MSWASELEKLNQACLGEFGIPVTFIPQDGSGAQTITGIILNPLVPEDVTPNLTGGTYVIEDIDVDVSGGGTLKLRITSGSSTAVSVARFLVDMGDITPTPRHGDVIQC